MAIMKEEVGVLLLLVVVGVQGAGYRVSTLGEVSSMPIVAKAKDIMLLPVSNNHSFNEEKHVGDNQEGGEKGPESYHW